MTDRDPNAGRVAPFLLLSALFGDDVMVGNFSEERSVECWLQVEIALARAQASLGIIADADADAIEQGAVLRNIDRPTLWAQSYNVGYPILPLVRMVAAALPEGPNGRVHYGTTTQDIMDTGLVLQVRDALERLEELVGRAGDAIASVVDTWRSTVIAGRTHGQHAVPTTVGAKMSTFLAELDRHRTRIREVRARCCLISLYGAGGTSAAMGENAPRVRAAMAELLGLETSDVPWHVSRDSLSEFGLLCAMVSATAGRLAAEVINLSRTEIGEAGERDGHHHGASSTMPQKSNPVRCEAVVGMAATAGAMASALFRAMEAGHERAAGEWQIEWEVLPQLACLAAGCLRNLVAVVADLDFRPEAMTRNLGADGGLIMAEAYMMLLAGPMGREVAHDAVYEAARRVRATGVSLVEALKEVVPPEAFGALPGDLPLTPDRYVGQADQICSAALALWRGEPGAMPAG